MEFKYISPFTDLGFKKLFGEEANKRLLINFLNDLLPIKEKIININFKKNQQIGDTITDRSSIYDVFCEDEKKNHFIVEMQNARQTYFKDRTVFNSTFPIRDQAIKGIWDFELKSVYCVGLLGFNLNDSPTKDEKLVNEYIHTVQLKDQNEKIFYNELKYIFVELPKFEKKENEIKTHLEKWMFFLKNLENFDNIPDILKEDIFEEAFKVAEIANFSDEQRFGYEQSLKYDRDNINIIDTATRKGKEEGLQEGMVKVAQKMLFKNIDIDLIKEVTGLSNEEIQQLSIV